MDRLAKLIETSAREDLMALASHEIDGVIDMLAGSWPRAAAQLHVAFAMCDLGFNESEFDEDALVELEQARSLYLRAGRSDEWETIAREIRTTHGQKGDFMRGFERVCAGTERPGEG
jgi:hypothetical protein